MILTELVQTLRPPTKFVCHFILHTTLWSEQFWVPRGQYGAAYSSTLPYLHGVARRQFTVIETRDETRRDETNLGSGFRLFLKPTPFRNRYKWNFPPFFLFFCPLFLIFLLQKWKFSFSPPLLSWRLAQANYILCGSEGLGDWGGAERKMSVVPK